jgi:hypothetical protein
VNESIQEIVMALKITQFSFDEETKVYVAEASELGIPPDKVLGTLQIEFDGFVAEFIYKSTILTTTLVGWSYRPTSRSVYNRPSLEGCEVHILND